MEAECTNQSPKKELWKGYESFCCLKHAQQAIDEKETKRSKKISKNDQCLFENPRQKETHGS